MKKVILFCSCLLLPLVTQNAEAFTGNTWDPQGASGNATGGTWENASWDTADQLGAATPANFVEGEAANWAFGALGGSASTFTVTMNANHTVAGWFNGPLTPKSCFVTITGTGTIILPNKSANALQGLDTGGSTLGESIIDVPIADTSGTILILEGSGQNFLNGANTYVGGTYVGYATSSGTGIQNFNNSASFGTGTITFSNCAGGAFVAEGSSAITIPNKIVWNHLGLNPSYNYVGNAAGVTYSGTWGLGTNTPKIGSGGGAANINIISGVMSSSGSPAGGIIAWSTAGGTLEYNNTMTYTGATIVSNIVVLALGPNGGISGTGAVTVQTNATLADTNTSGTRTIAGALTFQASGGTGLAAAKAIFNASGSTAGSISVGGNLTLNTTPITVHVSGSALVAGSYRLISCTGTVSGSASTTPTITGIAIPGGDVASISTTTGAGGHVDLLVGVAPSGLTLNPTPSFSASSGGTVYFTASLTSAGSPAPTYTWTLNNGALTADAHGQGTANLTINPSLDADAGTYTVTVANVAGSVNASSTLVVQDPSTYSAATTTMTLNFAGPVGQNYRVWSSGCNPTPAVLTGNVENTWNFAGSGQFQAGPNSFQDTSANCTGEIYVITVP